MTRSVTRLPYLTQRICISSKRNQSAKNKNTSSLIINFSEWFETVSNMLASKWKMVTANRKESFINYFITIEIFSISNSDI